MAVNKEKAENQDAPQKGKRGKGVKPAEPQAVEVTHVPTQEVIVLDADAQGAKEIQKYDINEAKIKEFKKQFGNLSVKSLEDKDIIKKLEEGKKAVRSARTAVEAKRKELKAPYILVGEKIDEKAKSYTLLLKEIEEPIDAELDKIKAWEKEAAEKAEKEAEARLKTRMSELQAAGLAFNGAYYAIGETISMDISTIKGWDDDDYNVFLAKVKLEKQKLDEAAEQERIAAEEKAAAEQKEREEFEEKKKKQDEAEAALQKERDDFEREKKELQEQKDELRRQKIASRESQLSGIGLTFDIISTNYIFANGFGSIEMTKGELEDVDDSTFTERVQDISEQVRGFVAQEEKDKAEKKEAADKAEDERIAKLEKEAEELKAAEAAATKRWESRMEQIIALGYSLKNGVLSYGNEYGMKHETDRASIMAVPDSAHGLDGWDEHFKTNFEDYKVAVDINTQENIERIEKENKAAKGDIVNAREFSSNLLIAANPPAAESPRVQEAINQLSSAVLNACKGFGVILQEIEDGI